MVVTSAHDLSLPPAHREGRRNGPNERGHNDRRVPASGVSTVDVAGISAKVAPRQITVTVQMQPAPGDVVPVGPTDVRPAQHAASAHDCPSSAQTPPS